MDGRNKYGEQPKYITANPFVYKIVKDTRKRMKDNKTVEEEKLWNYLKNKKIGYKIRRQHVIDRFIVDFVCLKKKVIIEIDGKIHLKQKEYDRNREKNLIELGYQVIRFRNSEVIKSPVEIALKIKSFIDNV